MPLSVSNNISALNALSTKQAVSSNNIANAESSKFKKSTAVLEEGQNGAVSAKVQKVNTPGVMINQPDGTVEELSNVDLGQELTGMIPTQRGYEANLKALQAQGEMEDTTLDLIG
ncbi:flagellar basal-body rod protein FlgC [Malonomonas rubra DSM 5091]|uniref:Flagellar basal-body rod protein FlgC n=1 Tax=Malonomonas rubra DSM 5091 TaxID=1122189 RepID=A0A1M6LQ68_MALRU|nr:flagellar basal body rod C-terminal domain-containing protein [Malonomonas rubra]SHJ73212.1 flagellar basal-body rod protein FlgC [Malonomonas rubra DSM 5091]